MCRYLNLFLMAHNRVGLIWQLNSACASMPMSRFLPWATTYENYHLVLNFRSMQWFPSQPITSVSCTSGKMEREEKNNIQKEKVNFIYLQFV